ncbi:MAG: hypothetical protein HPZ91_17705 [Lentisphaeria bacterium]|nr:hypothetical protein [Lentisphaeria bacterium]
MREFTLGTMYWINSRHGFSDFDADCRKIAENGYGLIRLILWWELIEETEGEYDFSLPDRVFRAAEKNGLRIMCTIGFYPPYWLTRRLDSLGMNDPGRYPSLQRPEVRGPLSMLIREMVTRYRGEPALESWNVWNEPTLNQTKSRPVLEKFAAWLRRRCPDREALAERWRGEYPVFSSLLPGRGEELDAAWLECAFRLGDRGRTAAMRYDFAEFAAGLLCEELRCLCGEVERYDTVHPTHTNLHSIHDDPVSAGREFYRSARVPGSISSSMHQSNDNSRMLGLRDRKNFYSCGVDRTWSWLKGGRAMVGELQVGTSDIHVRKYTPTPETVFYELWHSYAAGLDGVIHWLWQAWRAGTFENGEFGLRAAADGGETPRSRAVARFAALFRENREELLAAERVPARIAILDSYANSIYRHLQQEDHPYAPGIGGESLYAVLGCYRALNEANFQVDFVSDEEVREGKLSRYRVLFLPQVNLIGGEAAGKIAEFVRNGGAAWADGRFAALDEHMYLRGSIPGHGFTELFGVREADYVAAPGPVSVCVSDGRTVGGRQMRQTFEPVPGAEVRARYPDGGAAAVSNRPDRGRTRIWGIELCRRLYDECGGGGERELTDFALECGVEPMVRLPEGVAGRLLTGGGAAVFVLYNYTENAVPVRLAFSGASVKSLCGASAFDGETVSLELPPAMTEVLICRRSTGAKRK